MIIGAIIMCFVTLGVMSDEIASSNSNGARFVETSSVISAIMPMLLGVSLFISGYIGLNINNNNNQ